MVVTNFLLFPKCFQVNLDTRELVWSRFDGGDKALGTIDVREIKELRPGKQSKEFQKWSNDVKNCDDELCFSIFYGPEFRLKTISLVLLLKSDNETPDAKSKSEVKNWIDGNAFVSY